MPPTRRNSQAQASTPTKTSSQCELKTMSKDKSTEHSKVESAISDKGSTLGDGSARRSSRQRTISKRLQDMEEYYGKKKAGVKREKEESPSDSTPSKKKKQDDHSKSEKTKKSITPTSPSKGGNQDKKNRNTSLRPSIPPNEGRPLPIPQHSKSGIPTKSSEDINNKEQSTIIQHTPPVHIASDVIYSEAASKENSEAESEKTTALSDLSSEDQSISEKPKEKTTGSLDMTVETIIDSRQAGEHEQEDCSSNSSKATDPTESTSTTRDSSESNDQKTLSSAETKDDDVADKGGPLKEEEEEEDKDMPVGNEKDNQYSSTNDENLGSKAVEDASEAVGEDAENADLVYVGADGSYKMKDLCQIVDAKSNSVIIMVKPEGGSAQIIQEQTTDVIYNAETVGQLVQQNEESQVKKKALRGDQSDNLVNVDSATQESDHNPQFVVLEDGRQLLLSNADALATAADAVASLSQMKEVSFIIANDDSTATPITSTDGQKIKFVTINTGGVQSDSVKGLYGKGNEMAMRILPDGQLSSVPATVLSPDGLYHCSLCSYKTDKKGNWYKHRYTHMAQRRYQCDKCGHKATTSSNLKRHMLIHTDIKFFSCDRCDAQFRQKIHLVRHIKYKHEKKTVKCTQCEYTCASVSPDLMAHIRRKHTSTDQAAHSCLTCSYTAASLRDLKQHEKFHKKGPELKLFCESCSFVTDCASRLRRHELVHSKARPYCCALCSYRGSQKEHVLRHLRTKHKLLPGWMVYESIEEVDGEMITTLLPADDLSQTVVGEDEAENQQDSTMESADSSAKTEIDDPIEATAEKDAGVLSYDCFEKKKDATLNAEQGDQSIEQTQESGEMETVSEHDDTSLQKPLVQVQSQSEAQTHFNIPSVVVPDISSLGSKKAATVIPNRRLRNIIYENSKEGKKKYPPADFSTREKVFSCIHCTMKFSKLINLYKHLTVQHKDVHTPRSDGFHTCVWCEYQTNKWKNLLVHMRKHNYREEYGMAATRYACVVCTYSSQHRKALYAHMMKKHKIQIYVKSDGSASCIIDNTIPGTMSGTDGNAVVLDRPQGATSMKTATLSGVAMAQPTAGTIHQQRVQIQGSDMIIEAANNPQHRTLPQQSSSSSSQSNTQMVMIELEPGQPATAVEILAPGQQNATTVKILSGMDQTGKQEEDVDHEAADAIEGLQALAEQVIAVQQEQALEEGGEMLSQEEDPVKDSGETVIDDMDHQQRTGEADEETQIHIQDSSGQTMEGQNIQLTPEQLMQLSSGDYIEINGEMYKVEVAEDAAEPGVMGQAEQVAQ